MIALHMLTLQMRFIKMTKIKSKLLYLILITIMILVLANCGIQGYNHNIECSIFVSESGNDTNNGSSETPVKSIAKAIEIASPVDFICVAEGEYESNETITIIANRKLYGGFSTDFVDRDINAYKTILTDTRTTGGTDVDPLTGSPNPNKVIHFGTDVTRDAVLDGFTINAGGGEYATAIFCNGASPTILYNTINGGDVSQTGSSTDIESCAVYNYDGASPKIINNIINSGTADGTNTSNTNVYGVKNYSSIIILAYNKIICNDITGDASISNVLNAVENVMSDPEIFNNYIYTGSITGDTGITMTLGISNENSSPTIRNNTINGGSGPYFAVGVNNSYNGDLDGNTFPLIENNIIYTENGTSRYGIREKDALSEPASVKNNNVFNCDTALYKDNDGTTSTDLLYISDTGAFTDNDTTPTVTVGSGNVNETLTINLNTGEITNDPVPATVSQGGIAGSSQDPAWSFVNDINDTTRTAPWSIGAYEYD